MPLSRLAARHSRMLSKSHGGRVSGDVACVWPVLTRLLSVPCLGHKNRARGAAQGPSKPRNRQMSQPTSPRAGPSPRQSIHSRQLKSNFHSRRLAPDCGARRAIFSWPTKPPLKGGECASVPERVEAGVVTLREDAYFYPQASTNGRRTYSVEQTSVHSRQCVSMFRLRGLTVL